MPSGLTTEIRPGVHRPDWSVITKSAARTALMGRGQARSDLCEKWSGALPPAEDLAWRTVLEVFASGGTPPSVAEVAETVGIPDQQARMILADLQARDLLAMDESAMRIVYAYPFSGLPTEHRVEFHGRHLFAVCAIDALGVGAMLGIDTTIKASCRACGGHIEVSTTGNGKALSNHYQAEAIVWCDFAYTEAAALSCCPAIAFFCSDAHLEQWLLVQRPKRIGYRLTVDEGLEVARALFEPVLAAALPGGRSV